MTELGEGLRRRRLLAAAGDANDPALFGGIPYHFLHAAIAEGVLDAGLSLKAPAGLQHRARWASWNLYRVLLGAGIRGYQYSESRLNVLWSGYRNQLADSVVVNMFQLYPQWVLTNSRIEKWFSIDQTLRQAFAHYLPPGWLSERTMREALHLEHNGYQSAAGIIVHSAWARDDVIQSYGIPQSKVHVVKPAANLEAESYAEWERDRVHHATTAQTRPIRFVFVGVDWYRKGLDRLLRGFAIAREHGLQAELRVIGCDRGSVPAHLRGLAGVQWFGFISKQNSLPYFMQTVGDCDVGCLLSRAEAAGIGLHEYQALGLAVLGTSAGGSAEQLIPEASIIAEVGATDGKIAAILMALEANPQRLASMKFAAWKQRHNHLWPDRARQVDALLSATELGPG